MHGLHLIKFLDREPGSSQVVQNNSVSVRQRCNQTQNLVSQIFKPHGHTEIDRLTKRPSVQQCISQIFGRTNYDMSRSKISERFNSFLLRKRKHISKTSVCTGKIKDIRNNKEKKTKRKKCLRSGSVSDKIEVLFKSKNWKSKRRRSLALNSKKICKYAIKYSSKSTNDLNVKKNGNNKFCCRLHIPQVNRRRRSSTLQTAITSCDNQRYHFYSDHTIPHNKVNIQNITCHHHAHQLGGTYNVIDFPNAVSGVPNDSAKCEPVTRLVDRQQIAVPPPSVDNSNAVGENVASLPVKRTCSVPTLLPQNQLKPRHLRSKVLSKYKKSSRSKRPACPIFITKSVKFTLFALSLIIWFPCILIISLLWIVSHPLRPHEMIETVKDIESCKTKACQNDNQDFWQSIYSSVASAVKKLLRLYEAMFSLIKIRNGKRNCTRYVTSRTALLHRNGKKQYPNPRNKYKLFYDNDRGWMMKLIKIGKEKCSEKTIKTNEKALLAENTFKKNESTINLTKRENISKVESPHKGLIKDSKETKKERDLVSQNQYTQSQQESDQIKSKKTQGISRNRQNINDKVDVSDCICDRIKKTEPQHVNCICKAVQTEYEPLKSKNIPVYSSLQKSAKFVTFDERIQPHSNSQCGWHVVDNVCSPSHLRKCCSLKSSCIHHCKQNEKIIEKNIPSVSVIQRRCLCNCKFNKPINRRDRKYAVPNKLYTKQRSQIRKTKGQRKAIQQKPRPKRFNKFSQFCQKFRKKAAIIIKEADNKVWNFDNCEDTFVQTLRKRPWAWVHRRWPKFYPYFLIYCKFYENLAYAMLYVCTACIWCPVFCCCYFCCNLFCRCVL